MPEKRNGLLMRTVVFLSAAWIALPILVAQNLIGMYLNLWLDFSKYSSVPKVFSSVPTLDAHVAIGVLIVTLTFGRFVIGLFPQNRPFRIPSILLFVFALLAFGSGVEFTFFGNKDLYSFTMELGFGGIIVSAAYSLYLMDKLHRQRS